jgi:hypothetical protein
MPLPPILPPTPPKNGEQRRTQTGARVANFGDGGHSQTDTTSHIGTPKPQ